MLLCPVQSDVTVIKLYTWLSNYYSCTSLYHGPMHPADPIIEELYINVVEDHRRIIHSMFGA